MCKASGVIRFRLFWAIQKNVCDIAYSYFLLYCFNVLSYINYKHTGLLYKLFYRLLHQ